MATEAFLTERITAVQAQIKASNGGVEQSGRGDKYVKFRPIDDLYRELTWLENRLARMQGKVNSQTYIRNGGRGYVQ